MRTRGKARPSCCWRHKWPRFAAGSELSAGDDNPSGARPITSPMRRQASLSNTVRSTSRCISSRNWSHRACISARSWSFTGITQDAPPVGATLPTSIRFPTGNQFPVTRVALWTVAPCLCGLRPSIQRDGQPQGSFAAAMHRAKQKGAAVQLGGHARFIWPAHRGVLIKRVSQMSAQCRDITTVPGCKPIHWWKSSDR
jgi:hypothetical protein